MIVAMNKKCYEERINTHDSEAQRGIRKLEE